MFTNQVKQKSIKDSKLEISPSIDQFRIWRMRIKLIMEDAGFNLFGPDGKTESNLKTEISKNQNTQSLIDLIEELTVSGYERSEIVTIHTQTAKENRTISRDLTKAAQKTCATIEADTLSTEAFDRITGVSNYMSIRSLNDPFELINLIESIVMNHNDGNSPRERFLCADLNLHTAKQSKTESNDSFFHRFCMLISIRNNAAENFNKTDLFKDMGLKTPVEKAAFLLATPSFNPFFYPEAFLAFMYLTKLNDSNDSFKNMKINEIRASNLKTSKANTVEAVHASSKSYVNPNGKSIANNLAFGVTSVPKHSNSISTCSYCKKRGHTEQSCFKKRDKEFTPTCNICMKPGHADQDCRKSKNRSKLSPTSSKSLSPNNANNAKRQSSSSSKLKSPSKHANMVKRSSNNSISSSSSSSLHSSSPSSSDNESTIKLFEKAISIRDNSVNNKKTFCYGSFFYANASPNLNSKSSKDYMFYMDCFANIIFTPHKELLSDITYKKYSISTVAGETISYCYGYLPFLGKVLVCDKSALNGISQEILERISSKIDYIPGSHYVFSIKIPGTNNFLELIFKKNHIGYGILLDKSKINQLWSLLNNNTKSDKFIANSAIPKPLIGSKFNPVSKNKEYFSKKQLNAADRAFKLYKTMGYPGEDWFKRMISNGSITNLDFDILDFENAMKISGYPIPFYEGKSKRRHQHIHSDHLIYAPVPQNLYADVMYWDGYNYVITVAKPLHLVTTSQIDSITSANAEACIRSTINLLNQYKYEVKELHLDRASAFTKIYRELKMPIPVHIVGTDQHVVDIEVEIRTFKEFLRSIMAGVHYNIPITLKKYLIIYVTTIINLLPRGSAPTGAKQQLTGASVDIKKLQGSFGQYAQDFHPSKAAYNQEHKRSVGVILLYPLLNRNGSWCAWNIKTFCEITVTKPSILPANDSFINHMNSWANEELAEKSMIISKSNESKISRSRNSTKKSKMNICSTPNPEETNNSPIHDTDRVKPSEEKEIIDKSDNFLEKEEINKFDNFFRKRRP